MKLTCNAGQEDESILNALLEQKKMLVLKSASGAVGSRIKDGKKFDDIIDILVNKGLKGLVFESLVLQEKIDFLAPSWSSFRRRITSWQGRKHGVIGGLDIEDVGEYLAGTCAKMTSGIGILRIQSIKGPVPAIVKIGGNHVKFVSNNRLLQAD